MNALNLYLLCQNPENYDISEYYRTLANVHNDSKLKKCEIDTLKQFVGELIENYVQLTHLDNFFYDFSIPHISKEFDLLKIYEDDCIVNIELKSREVEEEKIKKQLEKNRYYLSHLEKKIISFTYVKIGDTGIVYTYDDNSGLIQVQISDIISAIGRAVPCVTEKIEELFRAKEYLISPINTPEKFIHEQYYLTDHQEEIKVKIINSINSGEHKMWGIQGGAGTGKTLLLYDIAKDLSSRYKLCIVHCGILSQGHEELNKIMDNVDILPVKVCSFNTLKKYQIILVDESQRIYPANLYTIISAFQIGKNCIFSYDYKQVLSKKEMENDIPTKLREYDEFYEESLSVKIRTNYNILEFIECAINLKRIPGEYVSFRNIEIIYARRWHMAIEIVKYYENIKGFKFISYTPSIKSSNIDYFRNYDNTHEIIGQEFDNVIFSMDDNFQYTEEGRLQGKEHPNSNYIFYQLWYQGVSRAREKLCILVIDNEELFEKLIEVKRKRK